MIERLGVPAKSLLGRLLGVEVDALEIALILHQVANWNNWQALPVLLSESSRVDGRMLVLELLEFLHPAQNLNDFLIVLNVPPVIVAIAVHLILIFRAQSSIATFTWLTDQ